MPIVYTKPTDIPDWLREREYVGLKTIAARLGITRDTLRVWMRDRGFETYAKYKGTNRTYVRATNETLIRLFYWSKVKATRELFPAGLNGTGRPSPKSAPAPTRGESRGKRADST